ncbi:MAG: N-6 DNA methylase [Opitutae bacterium]|nr:N-6 DNA methylase [Opitutae bacterium]
MEQTHLSRRETVNLGSFYTPPHLVHVVAEMIRRNIAPDFSPQDLTILDSSCGYGAFFSKEMRDIVPARRFVGGDIDRRALAVAAQENPDAEFVAANALSQISRDKYGIGNNEPLLIVANPPYNDVTSLVNNAIKSNAPCEIDAGVRTRDLGISFLLSFAKLTPEFVAVLHPLSYLIKHANFGLLAPFFANYALADSIVANSHEFSGTSRGTGFPIVVALYKRDCGGWHYRDVEAHNFHTLEGATFSLADFGYVKNYISKYPSRQQRATTDRADAFKFFAMRDINALKRSRTFISDDNANAVVVPDDKLEYYCYVDIFKDFAGTLPYYFGNFDVMFDHEKFLAIKGDFLALSIDKHPEIFSKKFAAPPENELAAARSRVRKYFANLFGKHANARRRHRETMIAFERVR